MGFRLLNAVIFLLSGFARRDPRKIVFGAWMGHQYADNPKYLMLYLATHHRSLDLVWCGRAEALAQIPPEIPVRRVRYGSLSATWQLITAGYCFVSHGFRDLGPFSLLRGATVTYLGHGLAIKHMGSSDGAKGGSFSSAVRRVMRSAESFSYCVASSGVHRKKLLKEFAGHSVTAERLLNTGQPRVDFLVAAMRSDGTAEVRSRFLLAHGLPRRFKVVTYMPTFREACKVPFSFLRLRGEYRDQLESLLRRYDAVLVEKSHFNGEGAVADELPSMRIHRLGERPSVPVETQELLCATDLLITDYSGCFLDYLILDRPVIHFAYDYGDYERAERGLYFALSAVAAGPVVTRVSELMTSIERCLREPDVCKADRARVRATMIEFERGDASERVVRALNLALQVRSGEQGSMSSAHIA